MVTKEEVQELISAHDVAVEQAVVRLHSLQTLTERNNRQTYDKNGVGFNATDAEFGSSLAEQVLVSRRQPGQRLSIKQVAAGRKMVYKYSGQLAWWANDREERVA